jgi:hypothetical protein
MNVSSNASDLISYQGLIEPVAGSSTYVTGWVYGGSADAFSALVTAGAVTGTVDAKIEQASDSSGTGAKDLTGSDITQLTAAGSALIQFKPGDLDNANDFTHVRLSVTTSNAADVAAGALIGACVRNAPLASGSKVDETVTV